MAWRIEFDRVAERELDKPEPKIARRILKLIQDRMAARCGWFIVQIGNRKDI